MFDPSPIARRTFLTSAYTNTLRPLFQWLSKIIFYPGLVSLVLFYVLYSFVEYTLTNWYFVVLGSVWKPAFPLSWRIVLLSLFVLPVLASTQLVWLAWERLALVYRWWRCKTDTRSSPSQGYMMLDRSESSSLEEGAMELSAEVDECEAASGDAEQGSLPHPPFHWLLQLAFWLALLCASLWLALSYEHAGDVRYRPLIEHANAHPKKEGYADNERIFIAAMFFDNERVIPYWSDSLVQVIHYLGPDNVFVSILESGSRDQSSALLRKLDDRLDAMGVARRILIEDTSIIKPDNMGGKSRIDFLAGLRNRALEPLVEMGGYDKVVFSNDIYIEPETFVELLKTADGEYDMACGMDFGHFGLYDLWVIRDKQGRLPSSIWPFFFDQEDYEAMQTESPVPVFTCWNGIVVFAADPVLPIHLRSNGTRGHGPGLSRDPLPFALPASHPAASDSAQRGPSPALTPPIGFRSSAPDECFSSESFLFSYDLRRLFGLERIWVNPRVVVGYRWRYYVYFKWLVRHPVLEWWIEKVYDGAWMQKDIMVIGDPKHLLQWDGGDCHPWW